MRRATNPELASLWRERVARQRGSGLSIVEYCRRERISAATFHAWKRRLGGTLFLALTFVAGASWHVAFRRVPEAMAMTTPITGGLLLAVLALGAARYGWHAEMPDHLGTFWFKQFWLTPGFWFARSVAYVVQWSGLSALLVNRSRRQDTLPAIRSWGRACTTMLEGTSNPCGR